MPSGTHEVVLNFSKGDVWKLVSNMDLWAPLVPGYIEHEILNEKQSTWTFNGDLGIVQKVVRLQVDIIEWKRPSKIIFKLTGLNDNVVGSGFFKADTLDHQKTKMTGYLDISAKGIMAPMINNILKAYVAKTIVDFTESIKHEIIEMHSIPINI